MPAHRQALQTNTTIKDFHPAGPPLSSRPQRFSNSDPGVVIGDFPWYEMVWRTLRGDFRPLVPPAGGYEAFARAWCKPVDHARLAMRQHEPVITWLGHVTLLLQVAGLNILFDPTLAPFAGPWGRMGAPRRVPAPLTAGELPPIDVVLISHNHYDHLCHATVMAMMAAGQTPRFYVPSGLKKWFDARRIPQVTEMDWWEETDLPLPNSVGALRLMFTPSQHWSRRTPFDTNASLWGGYGLTWTPGDGSAPWRFLFPGDTGYSKDFRDIGERFGAVDFLALPIGAYLPRDFMKPMHVNPSDALRLMRDLGARQAMAVHWGTFALTQEAFDHPPLDLAEALALAGQSPDSVWLMRHGETRAIARTA